MKQLGPSSPVVTLAFLKSEISAPCCSLSPQDSISFKSGNMGYVAATRAFNTSRSPQLPQSCTLEGSRQADSMLCPFLPGERQGHILIQVLKLHAVTTLSLSGCLPWISLNALYPVWVTKSHPGEGGISCSHTPQLREPCVSCFVLLHPKVARILPPSRTSPI